MGVVATQKAKEVKTNLEDMIRQDEKTKQLQARALEHQFEAVHIEE